MTVQTHETATAEANVRAEVYDVAVLRYIEPCWDALPDRAKIQVAREAPALLEIEDHNTTCIEMDESRVEQLDATTPDSNIGPADVMEIGDDATTPAYDNRSLNNKIADFDIAEYDASGTDLILNGVLGTEQGNDAANELTEIGVRTTSGHFLNHSTFTSFEKTNNRSVVFEVTLSFTNQ